MPAKTARPKAKPRPPERDYSHRALLDKLGVEDVQFLKDLAARVSDFARENATTGTDIIFAAAENTKALARLKSLAASLAPTGAIWVVYPKGQKHIREVDVIAAGKSAGLTDNKVCKFSETHTALRFVIPLARR